MKILILLALSTFAAFLGFVSVMRSVLEEGPQTHEPRGRPMRPVRWKARKRRKPR